MSNTVDVLETSLQKTYQILGEIEEDLSWQGRRHQSYQALREVLHTLRDRLPVDVSTHFAAQLTLVLKGVYYDGWRPSNVPIKMDRQEFIDHVAKKLMLDTEDGYEKIIKTVIGRVFSSIDPQEMQKIIDALPGELARLIYPY